MDSSFPLDARVTSHRPYQGLIVMAPNLALPQHDLIIDQQ
jgi:hypothetical protein